MQGFDRKGAEESGYSDGYALRPRETTALAYRLAYDKGAAVKLREIAAASDHASLKES